MSRNSAFAAVLAGILLSGCSTDYLHRYDTVTLAAGDAVRGNTLLHAKSPFNPASHDTAIPSDGERASVVVARYRTAQPRPASSTATTTP